MPLPEGLIESLTVTRSLSLLRQYPSISSPSDTAGAAAFCPLLEAGTEGIPFFEAFGGGGDAMGAVWIFSSWDFCPDGGGELV
jgi:hypothetical protein